MFLRKTPRKKDGKTHDYWSVVENKRVAGGRIVQRHVLYLGEINASQAMAWRKAIEVFDDDAGHPRTLALFPEDRCTAVMPDASVVQLRLSEMRLCRPRQWGACWLAGQLWQALQLDRFWADRLAPSRKGTRWDQVLQVLVAYRLIAPGSEWKLHRAWFDNSAMADLLGADFALAEAHKLYACHDLLLQHKALVSPGFGPIWAQEASRNTCILSVSCRWMTNFAKMLAVAAFRRNSGMLWRSALATTSSEGGMPGRMVRSQEPKASQTRCGKATARY
jgi:hypothetical protein